MTAFAHQTIQLPWGAMTWEIRSVNHRYLEPGFKLPESLRRIENEIREQLRHDLTRGKVECNLRIQAGPADQKKTITLDEPLLAELINASKTIQQQLPQPTPSLNALELLQWPGIIINEQPDSDQLCQEALKIFKSTLKQLQESRQREGAQLKTFIEQRLNAITQITQDIRQQLPIILQQQKQKLQQRLNDIIANFDSDRLEQEMVMLAQKADIDEELDRLDAHINEARRVLSKGGPCGRRLDFLMQEFNREANTLSSKSIVSNTSQAAVELKVLIEQMREQIQNIE
jgi:uncharacterized protein (TIGR00255 family)